MEEAIPKKRREYHRFSSKKRIVIGKTFEWWRELKELNQTPRLHCFFWTDE